MVLLPSVLALVVLALGGAAIWLAVRARASRYGAREEAVSRARAQLLHAQAAADVALHDLEVLSEKNRRLERASHLKSEFLAGMSHELRTPLNAVLGFSELLLEEVPGPLNGEQREFLKDIQSSGKHLLAVINELLDLAKVEAGQMVFAQEAVDLREPVAQAMEMVRPLALKKQLELKVDMEREVRALADAKRLRQVTLNLLSNAIKFTPPGGRVEVKMRGGPANPPFVPADEAGPPSDFVELEVRDTGVGIDQAHHELVFEAFGQVQSEQAADEGTGLGLALVRRFVGGMRGDVRLESQLGQGARFIVRLPAWGGAQEPLPRAVGPELAREAKWGAA